MLLASRRVLTADRSIRGARGGHRDQNDRSRYALHWHSSIFPVTLNLAPLKRAGYWLVRIKTTNVSKRRQAIPAHTTFRAPRTRRLELCPARLYVRVALGGSKGILLLRCALRLHAMAVLTPPKGRRIAPTCTHASTPRPELRAAGCESLRAIAAGLEERGIPAARGGKWSAVQVSRLLEAARSPFDGASVAAVA